MQGVIYFAKLENNPVMETYKLYGKWKTEGGSSGCPFQSHHLEKKKKKTWELVWLGKVNGCIFFAVCSYIDITKKCFISYDILNNPWRKITILWFIKLKNIFTFIKITEYYFTLAVSELWRHKQTVQLAFFWFPEKIKSYWVLEKKTKKREPTEHSVTRSHF